MEKTQKYLIRFPFMQILCFYHHFIFKFSKQYYKISSYYTIHPRYSKNIRLKISVFYRNMCFWWIASSVLQKTKNKSESVAFFNHIFFVRNSFMFIRKPRLFPDIWFSVAQNVTATLGSIWILSELCDSYCLSLTDWLHTSNRYDL